jgi:hypothetical protein
LRPRTLLLFALALAIVPVVAPPVPVSSAEPTSTDGLECYSIDTTVIPPAVQTVPCPVVG